MSSPGGLLRDFVLHSNKIPFVLTTEVTVTFGQPAVQTARWS